MDKNVEKLLIWLGIMYRDSSNPPSRRYQAYYILNFYGQHHNPYRLMAQITAMCRDELLVPQPSVIVPSLESSSLVKRWGKQIETVVHKFFVVPAIADFEAHPFELFSFLPPDFEGRLDSEANLKAHNKMLVYERVGQSKLVALTERFGYHYVFRAGLREYFLTKLIAEHYNFMRVDHRSQEWRQRTQMTFYDLINKHPNMKLEELRLAISSARAYPYDILLFRNWIIRSRRSYHAMQACVSIMTDDTSEL